MARALLPNSTQIPDVILDHWMAELSGAEFKVLLYIARRTYGFGKESDSISLSQIAHGITRRDGTVLDRGTGASRSSVARSLKELEERGLVIRTTNLADSGREYQENTYRINLDWEPSSERSGGQASGGGDGRTGVVSNSDYLGSQRDYPVSKNAGGWSQNGTTVVSKSDPQETDLQETKQETAAPTKPDADADLVETLVREGVGRSAAIRLAKTKPEHCRRYLDWLPYADVKTTRGSWLANAIEHEWGPPRRLTQGGAVPRAGRGVGHRQPAPPREQPEDHGGNSIACVRVRYAQLERSRPEAIADFETSFAADQAKTERFAESLTEKGKREFFEQARSEEFRLMAFDRWTKTEGKRYVEAAKLDPPNSRPVTAMRAVG